jgi:hypothetical protein
MANPQLKVKTGPIQKKTFFEKFHFRNHKSRQVVMAILGVYLLGGGLLGFFLFNLNVPDQAEAGSNATITTSIRFLEDRDYEIGESVPLVVTLQNTSITQPVNNLSLNLFSTKDSIRWNEASNQLFDSSQPITPDSASDFSLPPLAAGERAEYLIDSTLQVKPTDYLAVLGRLSYENNGGLQEVETNRIYTSINPNLATKSEPLVLTSAKTDYAVGEQIVLTLSKSSETFAPLEVGTTGKVYINKQNSDEVVATFDCISGDSGLCEIPVTNLESGAYSALFIAENQDQYSQVYWFNVAGSEPSENLIPSELASLDFPFNNASVNGVVPVMADRVMSKNEAPDPNKPCVFEVLSGDSVVAKNEAVITEDRKCYTTLRTSQLPGPGVYNVRLANSSLLQPISFAGNNASLSLTNQTPDSQRGQSIQIRSENILDSNGDPVDGEAVTVSVYHRETSTVTQILSSGGQQLQVNGGVFETFVPGSYLENSGNYQIYMQLASGAISEFLSVSLVDTNLGFSNSGVIIEDYAQLRAGQAVSMRVTGVTDREGEQVNSGSCRATVFTKSDSQGVGVDGQIVDGQCQATIPAGQLTTAGPALITFADSSGNSKLNQSKQVQIAPAQAASYGDMYTQFSPARRGYSNNLIIGPVTDEFGNLTEAEGLKVNVFDPEGEVLRTVENLQTESGYLELVLPANTFEGESVNINLTNTQDQELLRKDVTIVEPEFGLAIPELPNSLSNQDNIQVKVIDLPTASEENSCYLRLIRNPEEIIEEEIAQEGQICELNWNLNQYRDQDKAILQMEYGETVFSQTVSLSGGEAGNIFGIYPQAKVNTQNELEISLLTTPILDRYGLPVDSGEVTWQYNGKIETSTIKNGFAELSLLASRLENRDIQSNLDQRSLDLDLEVKASLTSISDTNNVSVYLGNYDIATQKADFRIQEGTNYISTKYPKIFRFESESCRAFTLTEDLATIQARSHKQGGSCYVEVSGQPGQNTLFFEDGGYNLGTFDFYVEEGQQEIVWCDNEGDKCEVQKVLAPISSPVEAILYDEQNEYKFQGEELENTVRVSQNGLNPLKEYLLEVQYTDFDGIRVSHYQTIQGEKLSP